MKTEQTEKTADVTRRRLLQTLAVAAPVALAVPANAIEPATAPAAEKRTLAEMLKGRCEWLGVY